MLEDDDRQQEQEDRTGQKAGLVQAAQTEGRQAGQEGALSQSEQAQAEAETSSKAEKKKNKDDDSGVDPSLGLLNTGPIQLKRDLEQPVTSGGMNTSVEDPTVRD